MSAGEAQSSEGEIGRLTITGEDVTPERAELMARLARALGHSDIAYAAGTIEDRPDELGGRPSPPDIDAIVQAHRLHFELPPYRQGSRVHEEQVDSARRLGHRLIGSLIRGAADDYVRHNLPRAVGMIEVMASHSELADRSLGADMLETAYRETLRSGQTTDAQRLHGIWRQVVADPDLMADATEALGELIDHMDALINKGRYDLRSLRDELNEIEGHRTHPLDDEPN